MAAGVVASPAMQEVLSRFPLGLSKGENSVPCVQRYVVWESDLLCCSHAS